MENIWQWFKKTILHVWHHAPQDKELFNLGDSIYYALESVDGFSMEVDPIALMDSLLKSLNEKDDSPLLKEVIEEKKIKEFEKNI